MKLIGEIRVELTNKCNTNCVMCPRELMVTPYGVMSNELYRAVIDESVDLKVPTIVLCGFGELFLDKDVKQKLTYLKKKHPDQRVSLTSNGSLIHKDMADFLAECPWINIIRVSVSGFTPQTYKEIMRLDREKIYQNIVYLHKIFKEKSSPTQLRINGIYLPDMYKHGELDEYLAFWQEHCDILEVWRPHNWTFAYTYRQKNMEVSEVETCGRPDNGPVEIMWNGNYKLCCFDFDGRVVLGNYRDTPLRRFWEMKQLLEIQEAHRKKEFWKVSACKNCDQIYSAKKDVLVFSNAGISIEDRLQMTADFNKIESSAVKS